MADINDEFLSVAGMASAHAALVGKHEWFLHVKETQRFDQIKSKGIEPRNPGCAVPNVVVTAVGPNAGEIVCLRPKGTFDTTPSRGKKMFMMAVRRDALPKTIGLDWSYDGSWTLAPILRKEAPAMPNEEIFCEVVRRRGSVVSYEGIPLDKISVWTKGIPNDDPSKWPKLSVVDLTQVEQFD